MYKILFTILFITSLACASIDLSERDVATPVSSPTEQPTQQPTATTTAIPVIFQDEFDGSLASGWNWISEDPDRWSLTESPGFLRLYTLSANINDGRPKNLLVRPAPGGNFDLETLVNFTPTSNFQFAGLLIYQEQGYAIQLGRAFANCPIPNACLGNAIYFDSYQNFEDLSTNFATLVSDQSKAYLRIRFQGNQATGYYSDDGSIWSIIGTHQIEFSPTQVGVLASQGYEEQVPADFDYFTIKAVE